MSAPAEEIVVAEARPVASAPVGAPLAPVAGRAAVVAAGGFVAGAALSAVVRALARPRRRSLLRPWRRRARRDVRVAGTRSFLVDVHLLDKR